jgi:hypothetical protein
MALATAPELRASAAETDRANDFSTKTQVSAA